MNKSEKIVTIKDLQETLKIAGEKRKELIKNKLLYLLIMLITSLFISFILLFFGILFNMKFTTSNVLVILLGPFFIRFLHFLSHEIDLNTI